MTVMFAHYIPKLKVPMHVRSIMYNLKGKTTLLKVNSLFSLVYVILVNLWVNERVFKLDLANKFLYVLVILLSFVSLILKALLQYQSIYNKKNSNLWNVKRLPWPSDAQLSVDVGDCIHCHIIILMAYV